MPNNEPPTESDRLIARKAREDAQLILGQIHGIVSLAVTDVVWWLEKRQSMGPDDLEITADDIRRAGAEIHTHFGTLQAALNTGEYDQELVAVGFSGNQAPVKKKGILSSIGRFFRRKAYEARDYISSLRSSLKWGGTLIGSITAAFKKEIDRIPGAAAAGEAIKELIEVLLHASEPHPEENQTPTSSKNPIKSSRPM